VVSAVEPNHGPRAGFDQVIIKGEHLTPESSVCVPCTGDVVDFGVKDVSVTAEGTPHELLVIAPPHAHGTVDVTVTTNPGATSATSSADLYRFE
jgi:LEA14-like dessication related protein